MNVEHAEMVEKGLAAFIERRSRREPDPDEQEALWRESVRKFNAHRREENRRAWREYFECLAGSLRARAAEYDERAEKLLKGGHE